jgi:predicted phosphoadenosine phosphosulfate sulfurtransferase
MSRYKQFINRDVYSVAKERIHHLYDIHDTLVVCFSGGKDSQVLLHLVWEVAQERGLKFVNAVFDHDEFMLNPIVDVVRHYAAMPWVRMHHLCVPVPSINMVFNKQITYTRWDKNRENIRPLPDYAIRPDEANWNIDWFPEDFDRWQTQFFVGKVALLNGIRSQESRMRWRASVSKLVESYINKSNCKKATLCKPIYDWLEKDIFKYLYDNKIAYSRVYDSLLYAKRKLRTGPYMHPETQDGLQHLRRIDPVFYDQLLKIFPDQVLNEKYQKEMDRHALIKQYAHSIEGIEQYIKEHYQEGKPRILALNRLYEIYKMKEAVQHKTANVISDEGSFPLWYVLRYFIRGNTANRLLSCPKNLAKYKGMV